MHSLAYVCRRTGLSAHLVRVWERRYQAIRPDRSASGRRMYSDAELSRLDKLATAVRRGHRIGEIAALPDAELEALAGPAPVPSTAGPLLVAIESFDAPALRLALRVLLEEHGMLKFLHERIAPLLRDVGIRWSRGELTSAHEHFTSHSVREVLATRPAPPPAPGAPVLLLATPPGQHHDLGIVMAAALARTAGWVDVCLGACVPLVEVVSAARTCGARGVVLGLTHPSDDPVNAQEIADLMRRLPPGVACLAGGAAAVSSAATLAAAGVVVCADLPSFVEVLGKLGGPPP